MNTMQLACFLAVVETLNFARAAEQLHVTQPAVTQQIHSLEAELNLQLFRRTTRTVELTQAGLMFLGDAKAMLGIFERAKKRAECTTADTRETFVIGCHSNNDIFRLAQTLQQMKEQFPNLYPIFRVVPFQHLYQRLSEEAVDVVVAFQESGIKKTIHYQELMKIPMAGITKADSSLAQKKKLLLSDLKQEPIIVLDPQKCPEEYRKQLHYILDDRPHLDVYFCDAVEAAITLAQSGYGVAILPVSSFAPNSFLFPLPIIDTKPMSYGVYYKTLADHSLRKTFVKLAKDNFITSVSS